MKCEICNYFSNNLHNFSRHKCRTKTDFQCSCCLKYYKSKESLNYHIKNKDKQCKTLEQEKEKEDLEKNQDVYNKINCLTKELENLKKQNNVTNITNIQNITQNNNIIVVLPHNKSTLNHLTDADYFSILGRNLMSIPVMIEKIHFNQKIPQNQNIYISNIKNKYVMIYNGTEWSLQNRDTTIHNLIAENETRLEDWLTKEDVLDKYPTAMKRFELYLQLKEKDENLDMIKEEILLMLYNNRNIIIKSKQYDEHNTIKVQHSL